MLTRLALLCSVIIFCVSIAGCKTNDESQLHIRHSFVPIGDADNQRGFSFEMAWFVPPAQLFGTEKRSIIANMGLSTAPNGSPRINLDNETRLRLEDVAITKLKKSLEQHKHCEQGYKITHTRWLERSIQFDGLCL